MEENIDIEINETNWGKEQIIIKKKNINLIFIYKKKKIISKYIDVLNIKL